VALKKGRLAIGTKIKSYQMLNGLAQINLQNDYFSWKHFFNLKTVHGLAGKLEIDWHDSDSLGVDGELVGETHDF